jgi:hypothetical protein
MKKKFDLLVSFFVTDDEDGVGGRFPEGIDSNSIFTKDFDQRYLY